MIGRTVSHYRIDSQLGAGGMGVVYRAEDTRLGRAVALKFLSDNLAHDPDAVRRLRAEARAASALNHGGICTIHDIDEVDGHPFIVMELLKGRSLRDRIVGGPLKVHQLVDIGIEIADALQAAHNEGIIHRDITPANVFITDQGHVKLLDFGLAKLATLSADPTTSVDTTHRTAAGITLGTVAYMSPEQATGEELDARTDLFSTGVVLYECATGRHPFPGKSSTVILAAILNRPPVPAMALNPELPVHLQEVLNNCLEKDRELRYQSAGDLRADLRRVRRELESGQSRVIGVVRPGESAVRSLTPPRGTETAVAAHDSGGVAPPARWSRGWISAGSVALAIVIGAAIYAARGWWAPAPEPVRPAVETTRPAEPAAPPTTEPAPRRSAPSPSPRAETAAPPAGRGPTSDRPATRESGRSAMPQAATGATQPLSEPPRTTSPPPPPAPSSPREPEPSAVATPPAQTLPAPAPPPVTQPVPVDPPASQAVPAPAGSAAAGPARREPDPKPREDDEAAIRRIAATYARAIETKDLALFRSIKPNLSREEERRLQDGFRAVTSQRVALTVTTIEHHGDDATVKVKRRDTIDAAGRTQTVDSDQILQLTRANAGWVVVAIR
jgi:serine/threonine protein kinase